MVGVAVGSLVGEAVGNDVGEVVGTKVGPSVEGDGVGAAVKSGLNSIE